MQLSRMGLVCTVALASACANGAPSAPSPGQTPHIQSVRVSGLSATMRPGDMATAKAEFVLSDGTTRPCDPVWSVNDSRVVSVSPTGAVTAGLTGYATIVALCEGGTGSQEIRVEGPIGYDLVFTVRDADTGSDLSGATRMEFVDGPRAGQTMAVADANQHGLGLAQWPVKVRFTSDLFERHEVVVAEATGLRGSGRRFDVRVALPFAGEPGLDMFVGDVAAASEALYPISVTKAGPIAVRTWWSFDYTDFLRVNVSCNGTQLGSVQQHADSHGEGLNVQAPAGACEVRLLQFKNSPIRYRVTIGYPR